MASLSCGIEAEMLGSLMMLASGRSVSAPSSARSSVTRMYAYSANIARRLAGLRSRNASGKELFAAAVIAPSAGHSERAIALESDFFEAHFNLGNIYHDLGRHAEAQACYSEALRLNPYYADTHFYLAVTLEKMGLSAEARPHWRAYQQLAPNGEWVELAREFSE